MTPFLKRPPWRTVLPGAAILLCLWCAYLFWTPGLDIRDGRHDRGRHGLWLAHGWLGADEWFVRNGKTNEYSKYRDPHRIRELADQLRRHHITDIFPHLCPAGIDGHLPPVDDVQIERFLECLAGMRVMPWIGGPNGGNVRFQDSKWRAVFTNDVASLLRAHPRLAGVHLNIEPLPSGDTNFLAFLEILRLSLPDGKVLSFAAYPPPTRWHPYAEVHWDKTYVREIARRCDQMVFMMYDAGQRVPKLYQHLMADWTREALAWSGDKPVLLGIPTYEDPGVDYHRASVENLTNALLGVHRGLYGQSLATNYQGVAIYCDWETSESEWNFFEVHFLSHEASR